jgi:hypothetical protein
MVFDHRTQQFVAAGCAKIEKEACCWELTPPAASQPISGRTASSLNTKLVGVFVFANATSTGTQHPG